MTAPSDQGKRRRRTLLGPGALVGAAMVVFAVLVWTGSAPAQTKPVSTGPVDIQAGQILYNGHCASCHGIGGVGSKGPELLNVGPAAVA